eukprot:10051611-Ditylum_brightwellii.AAC.1
MKMQMRLLKTVSMMRNCQVRDSTWNNTDLTLEETVEIEESSNASTDNSVENDVDTNVARMHRIDKKTLFCLLSSDSGSESSEEDGGGDAGDNLKRIIASFLVHKNVSEEPYGVACVNAAGGD